MTEPTFCQRLRRPRRPPRAGRESRRPLPDGRISLSGAIVWFAVSYGSALLGYLALNAFAARLLGDMFGYFVLIVTVSTVLGQTGLVGVHRGGLREAARLRPDDLEGLRDLRRGARAVSWLTLPVTAAITATVTFVAVDGISDASRWTVAFAMGALVWLSGQQKLWANYLRGFGQVRFASLLEGRAGGALVSAVQGLLLGAILLFYADWGLGGALVALAVAYVVPVAVAWRRVARVWDNVEVSGAVFRDLRVAAGRHWRFASNVLGAYLNSVVEIWIAVAILTAVDASLFSAAQRLSVMLAVPLLSLSVVFSPVVSRMFADDDRRLELLLRTGASLAASATAIVWLPMLLFPDTVLMAVYGSEFGPASPILVLLTIGGLANVLSGLSGTALMMSRHEDVVWVVQWAAVLIRVAAGLAMASLFGAVGLGASAATVTVVLYATFWQLARRRTGLRTQLTLRPSLRLLRETTS